MQDFIPQNPKFIRLNSFLNLYWHKNPKKENCITLIWFFFISLVVFLILFDKFCYFFNLFRSYWSTYINLEVCYLNEHFDTIYNQKIQSSLDAQLFLIYCFCFDSHVNVQIVLYILVVWYNCPIIKRCSNKINVNLDHKFNDCQ